MRYRPDWLVCGEVRDSDAAVPMLKAMTHGQSSLTTVHSASAVGALDKLALYLGTGEDRLPPEVAHNQLHQAIDFVVHLDRGAGRPAGASPRWSRWPASTASRCTTNTIVDPVRHGEAVTLRRLEQRHVRQLARAGFDDARAGRRVPMRTLAGAIVGLLAGAGVWLAIAGWRRCRRPDVRIASADRHGIGCGGGRRSSSAPSWSGWAVDRLAGGRRAGRRGRRGWRRCWSGLGGAGTG